MDWGSLEAQREALRKEISLLQAKISDFGLIYSPCLVSTVTFSLQTYMQALATQALRTHETQSPIQEEHMLGLDTSE